MTTPAAGTELRPFKVDIPDKALEDLRAKAGSGDVTVQELGGWSSLAMVQRYSHLAPGQGAAAVARIPTPRDSLQDSQQGRTVVALSAR